MCNDVSARTIDLVCKAQGDRLPGNGDVQITINAETVELVVRNSLNAEFVTQTDADAETDTQQGFGSEIISEVTTQWSREFSADQVTLSATFARILILGQYL